MIDTHCHLLPELDDGPGSEDEAVQLARGLVASGITFALCTPHYSRRFPTEQVDVLERHQALAEALEQEEVGLEVGVAAEVSPELAISADPDELLARSVCQRFLIVELLPDTPAVALATIVVRVGELGLLPVFAHPERCRALRSRHGPIDEARSEGALTQVVATSLIGRWGDDIAGAAWRLVDTGRADLIASDAHHPGHRSMLLDAAELVENRLGGNMRRELTESRPGLAVRGIHPRESDPAR
jgi:protein-tyrosine phosphatase